MSAKSMAADMDDSPAKAKPWGSEGRLHAGGPAYYIQVAKGLAPGAPGVPSVPGTPGVPGVPAFAVPHSAQLPDSWRPWRCKYTEEICGNRTHSFKNSQNPALCSAPVVPPWPP